MASLERYDSECNNIAQIATGRLISLYITNAYHQKKHTADAIYRLFGGVVNEVLSAHYYETSALAAFP